MTTNIQSMAVLTADDDGPGMNAAIRSATRMALRQGWAVWGVRQGPDGLLRGDLAALESRSVSHIIERGGTILGASCSAGLCERGGIQAALAILRDRGINALVVIGGREGMRAAELLHGAGLPTVGVPACIENNLVGADVAIGADTALNTAIEAIDRIQDTALAQRQAFVIELVGRRSGYQALMAGIAGGAEMVCIPEAPYTFEDVVRHVAAAHARGKGHCLVVVAEGAEPDARTVQAYLSERRAETGMVAYLTMLGHMQRGGPPTASDRYLATRLGAAAAQALAEGHSGVMVGTQGGRIVHTPLAQVLGSKRELDLNYLELATILAR